MREYKNNSMWVWKYVSVCVKEEECQIVSECDCVLVYEYDNNNEQYVVVES